MKPNPGHCPPEAIGRHVRVLLANGSIAGPWPADGKGGACWDRRGYRFDIAEYELAS